MKSKLVRTILPFALAVLCEAALAQSPESVARPRFKTEAEGFFECSADAAHSCELSAAACLSDEGIESAATLVLASDKPLDSKRSWSVLTARLKGREFRSTGILPMGDETKKIEALAVLGGGKYLASVPANDRDENTFQNILLWKTENLHFYPSILSVVGSSGQTTTLRAELISLYQREFGKNIKHVKVEGATALSNDILLLGIRSYGESFKNARDAVQIVSAKLTWQDGNPTLQAGELKVIADLGDKIQASFGKPFGLTELHYQASSQNLWMLVSHESDVNGTNVLEGRLLLAQLSTKEAPSIEKLSVVDNTQNAPLVFEGKPEGLCELSPGRMLVVFDDDRELIKSNQSSARTSLSKARYIILNRDDKKPSRLNLDAQKKQPELMLKSN